MKKEIRILSVDDAPFDKFKDRDVLVVGVMMRRGQWVDGVMSTRVRVDGRNSTAKLVSMINKSKFKPQLQAVILDGIAFGGFNIVDIERLNLETNLPVIVVIRRMPDFRKIKKTLKKLGKEEKYKLIEKAGDVVEVKGIYVQFKGVGIDAVKGILDAACTRSLLPESLRVSHMVGAGIIRGESKGNA
ncbi:DUF99 family protein [Candidatus Woesearchaeota archaeon]|nr:DUF99 family protein [Candidatus Woesearchaeota archaeon]